MNIDYQNDLMRKFIWSSPNILSYQKFPSDDTFLVFLSQTTLQPTSSIYFHSAYYLRALEKPEKR